MNIYNKFFSKDQSGLALWNARILRAGRADSSGLASFFVVALLVVLIALISLGFARLMGRSAASVRNKQLSSAADYAAQSAINDAANYIQTQIKAGKDPTNTNCSTLIQAGGPISNPNLSGDGSITYTCVLISTKSGSLSYTGVDALKSQIVQLSPPSGTTIKKLMFSWQATDRQFSQFPASQNGLIDETNWGSSKYAPLLRVTIYPIPAGGSLAGVQANSKTFYFYPLNSGAQATVDWTNTASGTLKSVPCKIAVSGFTGDGSSDCDVIIDNLNSTGATSYYARVTPIYSQADLKVQANDTSGNLVSFSNSQATVDVTAKAGNVLRRLQAKVDISGTQSGIGPSDDAFPEFAIRSANTICKRLLVPSSGADVFVDSNSNVACDILAVSAPPPGGCDPADPGCQPPPVGSEHSELACQPEVPPGPPYLGPCSKGETVALFGLACVSDQTGAILHFGVC